MKYLKCFLLLFISISIYGQNVPVKLHFTPPLSDFTTLRLVGSFNGWNNDDDNYILADEDNDGVYEITVEFAPNVDYMYKFVMDADWGQSWNDPDNPDINITDNDNSWLRVKDPMITYLLPRGVNSNNEMYVDNSVNGEPIRAVINHSSAVTISPEKVSLYIDGVKIDNTQLYNPATNELIYQPAVPLEEGEHSISVAIITDQGGFINKSSKFKREPGFEPTLVPVDFYFDFNNSRIVFAQEANSASAVGAFNNWNDKFNPLKEVEEGFWEGTAELEPGTYNYKIKVNGGFWLNDWDNPIFNPLNDNNSVVIAIADSTPSLKLISPLQGTIFSDQNTFTFETLLRPGVLSSGVDETSILLKVNGIEIVSQFDSVTSVVSGDIDLSETGYTTVEAAFTNAEGFSVTEMFTYGYFPNESGYNFIDAFNDEQYAYPDGVEEGSVDIKAINITDNETHNQLQFSIEMASISDRTRLGLIISNPTKSFVEDDLNLDLLLPEWNNNGLMVVISKPGNAYQNSDLENKIAVKKDPLTFDGNLEISSPALNENKFEFEISLELLDSLLGGWRNDRNITLFSYIAETDGSGKSMEVGTSLGGSNLEMDADIYDAAFIRSAFWQNRMLNNYIKPDMDFGPRLTALDGNGRGLAFIKASQISDSLVVFGPDISILNPGVEYWYDTLTIAGEISDLNITNATFIFNGVESNVEVSNGIFQKEVVLAEGENTVSAKAVNEKGLDGEAREITISYVKNHTPTITIETSTIGSLVNLNAIGSSPDDLPLTYYWEADPDNPANVSFSNNNNLISLTMPETLGEYYFTVTVTDSENRSAKARRYIIVDEDGVRVGQDEEHAAWIDKAVFYEIYPRSFSDQGGFVGIEQKIPEMLDLGINAIWLMPMYSGPTTHGYEITNYYGFEEDYGTEEEFRSLVEALHNNGIKIVLDFVVNHTGITHRFMQNVFEYKEYSPWANWYIWEGTPGSSNYEFLFDWSSLPNLNHTNTDVRKYFIDVAKHWITEYDIDGYRCDVAWGVEQRNSDFWQEWRTALKNIKPEVFLEAEASSSESVFYQNRFDSANDWDLRNDILNVFGGSGTINDLNGELRRTYSANNRPFRFLENHDENRVASVYDTDRSKLAHTIIMSANGVPLIYSGGEVGEETSRGIIDWTDPNNIRPYFKKLIRIRKQYIHNPVIERITNKDASNVYSYLSISDTNLILTVANFKDQANTPELILNKLPFEAGSTYYLTDLFDGSVIEVTDNNVNSLPIDLGAYEARIFYYGKEPVVVGVEDENSAEVEITEFKLMQNYPNPFNPSTIIRYQIPKEQNVKLKVYDILGREVMSLVNEQKTTGSYEVKLNGWALSSGVYIYRIETEEFNMARKFLLLK
ncbi:MAG: T9SS type A sorting domain-containing protein [Melioribacteraceae bacterium]|nr:T9SS type A sorting domain-containing protein [Melioribacteraceae bacterium]